MIAIDRLKQLPIFRDTPPSSLEILGREMAEQPFRNGDVICREGDKSGSIFLVSAGTVAVSKRLAGETAVKVVARLGAGEFFGEMSFLQDQAHSATVTAESDGATFVLPRSALDKLAARDTKAALESLVTIFGGLSGRLRATTRELVSVYEIARTVGRGLEAPDLAVQVATQLRSVLGADTSVGFYRWNVFNDEFLLLAADGPRSDAFPGEVSLKGMDVLSLEDGTTIIARMDMGRDKEGALVFHGQGSTAFNAGDRQLMETAAAVVAPALATAAAREEEAARVRLQQRKQERYGV